MSTFLVNCIVTVQAPDPVIVRQIDEFVELRLVTAKTKEEAQEKFEDRVSEEVYYEQKGAELFFEYASFCESIL